MLKNNLLRLVCLTTVITSPVFAEVISGRDLEERKRTEIGLSAGSVFNLEGEVQETTRPINVARGVEGPPPENYSWSELGIDEQFETYGFFVEHMWQYATLRLQVSHGNPQADSIADRDYYIGVGSISFEGTDYEYMKIPVGTPYTADIDVYSIELGVNITPVSFESDVYYLTFTPWLHLGVYGFITDYEIHAGEPTGVVQYQLPPHDFVVGGDASGTDAVAVPDIGLGGEVRFAISDNSDLSIEANVDYMHYSGNTGEIGISARNEKNVDIDFLALSARITLEVAMTESTDFLLGIEGQHVEADATIEAKDRSLEDIETRREKFDKTGSFSLNQVSAFIGLAF